MSNDSKTERDGPGRPTLEEQKAKKEIIFRDLYRGFKPQYIIDRRGFHQDTVYKYYHEYCKTKKQENGKTIAEEEDEERAKVKLRLEDLTFHAYSILDDATDEINAARKEGDKADKYYYNLQLSTMEMIRKTEMNRLEISAIPDSKQLKAEIMKEIEAKRKKNGKR